MGLFFAMPTEPQIKRAVAFVDGQNLFYAVKNAFGYNYPNYDVWAFLSAMCNTTLSSVTLHSDKWRMADCMARLSGGFEPR